MPDTAPFCPLSPLTKTVPLKVMPVLDNNPNGREPVTLMFTPEETARPVKVNRATACGLGPAVFPTTPVPSDTPFRVIVSALVSMASVSPLVSVSEAPPFRGV